jgi:hypothetical protein
MGTRKNSNNQLARYVLGFFFTPLQFRGRVCYSSQVCAMLA